MKNLFKFLPFVLFGFCLVFNSCSENDEMNSSDRVSIAKNSQLSVGEIHNLGLDFAYNNYLKNLSEPNDFTLAGLDDSLNSFLSATYGTGFTTDMGGLVADFTSYYFDNSQPDFSNIPSQNLKDELLILMDIIDGTIIEEDENSGTALFDLSQNLLQQEPSGLTQSELKVWKNAVDVMGHSALYWQENAGNWEAVGKGNTTVAKGWWG